LILRTKTIPDLHYLHKKYAPSITEALMSGSKVGNLPPLFVLAALAIAVVSVAYLQPNLFAGRPEGFNSTLSAASNNSTAAGVNSMPGLTRQNAVSNAPAVVPTPKREGFEDQSGPANFGNAEAPSGCYPRDQLTPGELLPKDPNSIWAQQNPMGTGSLKGKNFLSAGALIGVNTVGQTLRNANYQLRSEPANPQVPVSVFNVPTIEPDVNRRSLEIA
jgi:hypothetical protein